MRAGSFLCAAGPHPDDCGAWGPVYVSVLRIPAAAGPCAVVPARVPGELDGRRPEPLQTQRGYPGVRQLLLFALMFCGGIALTVQPSINGRLAQKTGILASSCVSFWVGALALLALVLLSGRDGLTGIGRAEWWELTGGFLGAFFVTMTILVVPRVGTAAAMAAVIAAQLTTGVVLDHLGLFRLQQVPFDVWRAAGVTLLMAGAVLVLWR